MSTDSTDSAGATAGTDAPRSAIERVFERYADAFATRDAEAVVALHSPGSVFWQHTDTEPVRGREAIATTFGEVFRSWPGLRFEVQRVLFGDDFWVLDWRLHADLDGREVAFDLTDLVTVDAEGLVSRKDTWVDSSQVARALEGVS